jgi:hypothetical protein
LWEDGIFLGIRGASGEIVVGDAKGVWKTRSVQRKPPSERWAEGALEVVTHVPWRVSDEDPNMDGERLQVEGASQRLPEPEAQLQREVVAPPNRFMIRKEDLEKHGYSANCPGCKSILRGTARQGHSESCRKRLEEEFRDDPRVKLQRLKEKAYVEKRLEEQDRKRARAEEPKEEQMQVEGQGAGQQVDTMPASQEAASSSSGPAVQVPGPSVAGDTPMEGAGEKRRTDPWEDLAKRLMAPKKARGSSAEGGNERHPAESSGDEVMLCLKEIEVLEAACAHSDSFSADGVLGAEETQPVNQEEDEQHWLDDELATFDTKTGDILDPVLVKAARREEI